MDAPTLTPYLKLLIDQKGSDLHLSSMTKPMVRIHGELAKVDVPAITAAQMETFVAEITDKQQRVVLTEKRSIDLAVKFTGIGIFRVNIFYQRHGLAAVFRALRETPPTFEELNLPPVLRKASEYPNGLVLVTGPTGSGKSTTLAAMITAINHDSRRHILTLEDPIEFVHESKRCMVNQRQLNSHFTDFASALKAALREDPDVILIGEMRDLETTRLAITAAETGHLVFATLHTNAAAKAVNRILDVFPGDEQAQIRSMLSESLRMVISQKLIPNVEKNKRVAFHDILVNTPAVANLIREGKIHQIPGVMQTNRKEGMVVLDQMLLEAVKRNEVDGLVAWEFANDKTHFEQWAPAEFKNFNKKPAA